MRIKNKLILMILWLLLLSFIINIMYGIIYTNDIKVLKNEIKFNFRYYTRQILQTDLEYKNINSSINKISKYNISVKLNKLEYMKDSGNLKLELEFLTNDNQIFDDDIGYVLKIYDTKKIFYNDLVGNMKTENTEELLNKKLYKNLDSSTINSTKFEINSSENENSKKTNIELILGENYEIADYISIEILDFMYRTTNEYLHHRAIEPMGEFKFNINF